MNAASPRLPAHLLWKRMKNAANGLRRKSGKRTA
jgi:hypothetical protein